MRIALLPRRIDPGAIHLPSLIQPPKFLQRLSTMKIPRAVQRIRGDQRLELRHRAFQIAAIP